MGLPLERSLLLNFTQNNQELVSILVDAGADVNSVSANQSTAIHMAVQSNKIEIVKLLLGANARPDDLDKNGETALHKVTRDNQIEIAKLLIDANANVNAINSNDATPLHEASFGNRIEIVQLLIEANADIDSTNKDGETPLHSAVSASNIDIIKILIKAGANVDFKDRNLETPLHKAVSGNNKDIVKVLIEARANIEAVNKDKKTPLHIASSSEQRSELVKYLLESGAQIDCRDAECKTPLLTSAKYKNCNIVEFLLSKGAEVNTKDIEGNTALSIAVSNDDVNLAQLLILGNAKVDDKNLSRRFETLQTPSFSTTESPYNVMCDMKVSLKKDVHLMEQTGLLWKALCGYRPNIEMAKLLIKHGADVNIRNDKNATVLMFAVDHLDVELVEVVVQAGADVDATDSAGDTALQWTLIEGRKMFSRFYEFNDHLKDQFFNFKKEENEKSKRILEILLKAGSSVHSDSGKCPMVLAVNRNNKDFVRLLIDFGGDVNSQDHNFNTVLMLALKYSSFEVADMLINAGCDVINLKNNLGQVALHVAVNYGRKETVKRIIEKISEAQKSKSVKCRRKNPNKVNRNFMSPIDALDKHKKTPLHLAAHSSDKTILKLLIQGGACVNLKCSDGNTALMLASYRGWDKAVQMLLGAKTDINIRNRRGETAILIAARCYFSKTVMTLFDAGADPLSITNIGNTGLAYSVTTDAAKVFLTAGVSVNVKNSHGRTPLHCQVDIPDLDVAELLIRCGAHIDEKDFFGDTPLIMAYKKGKLEIAKLLISAGANVNIQNKKGKTALMYASHVSTVDFTKDLRHLNHSVEAIEKLLEAGADVNMKDNLGFTAVMHAFKNNEGRRFIVINRLLDHGANINAEDYKGRNLFVHLLESNGIKNPIFEFLQQGANPVLNEKYRQLLVSKIFIGSWHSDDWKNEILRLFVCNGIFGSVLFKNGFWLENGQILKSVFLSGKREQMNYIFATCFFTNSDLKFIKHFKQSNFFASYKYRYGASITPARKHKIMETESLLLKAACEPWPLVKLAFITVSTMMGDSPEREGRIRRSQLPPELLMFQTPVARLPVSEWSNIPLCFDPVVYETLPRPRPLLNFWPFGRHLVI